MGKIVYASEAAEAVSSAFGIPLVKLVDVMADVKDVDAVKVVRCMECKHWNCADEQSGVKYGECRQPKNIRAFEEIWFNENWFCADGERKDEDGKA